MTETHTAGDKRSAWFFRPVILFAAAYLITGIIHESAHAVTAYALNVPFTLYHFAAYLARDRGSPTELAMIRVAGPLCSFMLGVVGWFFYARAKGSRSELLLLNLAVFGVGTFFGNLMSAAFVGDFSRLMATLHLPMIARYAASLVGFLLVCGLHFWAGWQLRRLSPVGTTSVRAMIVMVVVPVVLGAVIVALSSLPIPSTLVFGRVAEASFWVFAAAGLLISRNTPSGNERTLHVGWLDIAVLVVSVIVVRIMAAGIAFQQ